MPTKRPITVANGDGIGPEIMAATLKIILAAGAEIEPEFIDIGEKVYLSGNSAGIEPSSWESLRRTKVFLKAPITTPQGGGYKSLNVTTRKALGLYANVRPCVSYDPFIPCKHPKMDLVIIRENEEDLYAGIEHQQTPEVIQCLKLISRPGCEKIVRYGFEYAVRNKRKKVTCFTKDNIMKMTDGLFHKIFDEIGAEYPQFEKEHWIIDIGMAKLADTPEEFDVIIMPNLYGDIASDVAAQIAGSVGLAGSSNIGEECAMFEAIHGSAPRRAGQNVANPSGLLLGSVLMLQHIDQNEVATKVHNAWLKTLEDGIFTYDVAKGGSHVSTTQFADEVIKRIGQKPSTLKAVDYTGAPSQRPIKYVRKETNIKRELNGVDVFIYSIKETNEIGKKLEEIAGPEFKLKMISNRGAKVYPGGLPETFCTDHWRCRFLGKDDKVLSQAEIRGLLSRVEAAGFEWIKLENLYKYDGQRVYSLGQGE
ncbi:MAG: NADP-dependent isocitrate dehydrogenase [Candidatus Caenarcaniphilales bacterium]|nr:NADP-dependent isocitrate dehydrogenase [Candidatus Caenarcaniphilales bacterium]